MDKVCTKCKILKDISEFYKDKCKKDGLASSCKVCSSAVNLTYRKLHRSEAANRTKIWAENNQGKIKDYRAKEEVIVHRKEYMKNWRTENKAHRDEYRKDYEKEKCQNDPLYKLAVNLRKRIGIAIRNGQKKGSAVFDLGCTILELKIHLEGQFKPGMTWDNWSRTGWHIDHIKPLASFDLNLREEFLKAVHYTNLQPLWWQENLKKGKKINHSF